MRVLHLLPSNSYSGAENVVCQIMSLFRNTLNTEMVYCSPDGPIRQALGERNLPFLPLESLSVSSVSKVIKQWQPDIVHAHDMKASVLAAAAVGNIPLISHIHNNNFDSRGISLKSLIYLFAGLRAKHIFWVSESSCRGYRFRSFLARKSEVLYNIIDVDALYQKMWLDTADYNYDIVYVGRLTYPKNPQRLLQVIKRVVSSLPSAKIAIVGNGDMEEESKALAAELGLERNVDFLGFQSNPLKIVYDSKAMVMTSRWEGMPMCALEALALGVPIVTTPTDGLCVLVRDGETGYLSDDDDTLAARLIDLISDRALCEKLSAAARKDAAVFNDTAHYVSQLDTQYRKWGK